ncbi:hypothetical protein K435DRAFT_868881 [Dendrothele bispora CBS 962.96]|uniref:Uncharacterized protein n=1 Tax=Dendrothele bispora (strain CBS 962.96) TaxID=1314807 RepID=A0A4S8LAL0_DENBC|nr:hypothetical protein K435DRAFT_868881 [Dendrothele bispora CBS 962.96]
MVPPFKRFLDTITSPELTTTSARHRYAISVGSLVLLSGTLCEIFSWHHIPLPFTLRTLSSTPPGNEYKRPHNSQGSSSQTKALFVLRLLSLLPILASTPNNNTFSTPNSTSNNTPGTSTDGDNAQRPLNDPEATKYILAYNPVNRTANLIIVPNDFVPVIAAYGADTAYRHFQSEVKEQHEGLAKIFSKYPDRDAAKMQKIGAAQELLTILSSAHSSSFQDVMVNDLGFMENSFISAWSLAEKAFNQLQEAIPATHSKVNSLVTRYRKFRDDNDRRQKERGDQNVPPVAVANTTPVDGQTTNPSTASTTLQSAATIRSGPIRGRRRGLSIAGRTVNSSVHAPPNPDQDVAMADLSSSVDPNATPTTPANPPGTKSRKERSRSKKSEKRVVVDENTPAPALTATIVQEVSAQAQAIAKTVPRKRTISVDADSSAAKAARLEDSLKHKSLEELASMATNVMTLDRESLWALFTLGNHYRDVVLPGLSLDDPSTLTTSALVDTIVMLQNRMRSNTVESLLNLRNVQDSAFLLVDLLREHQDRLQDFSDKGGQTLSEIAKAKDEVLPPTDPYPTPTEEDKVLDEAEPLGDAATVVAHVSAPPSLAPSEQSFPDSEASYQTA